MSFLEGEKLLQKLKERKGYAHIYPDGELLHPFSALKVQIVGGGELLYEGETILKCDSFAGCFFCFSKDYSMVTLEKGRIKLSLPARWECLTWEGKPIFEDRFFEHVFVGDLLIGKRRGYTFFTRFSSLEVYEGEEIFRIVLDKREEYFARKVEHCYHPHYPQGGGYGVREGDPKILGRGEESLKGEEKPKLPQS